MNVRVDIGQLAEPDLLTDAAVSGVPTPGGQNTSEGVQGDGSSGSPIKLDVDGLTQETSIQPDSDFVVIYDVTAGLHRKVNPRDLVPGAQVLQGEISNANTNPAFPASPNVGDTWIITTNPGTVGGVEVEVGDQLIYSTSGWFVLQTNITEATQVEAEAGVATTKYISPATANPDNYTAWSGSQGAGDSFRMWSQVDNSVVSVGLSQLSGVFGVPMSPTAARVLTTGDDATGLVGRFDRPFRTISAALAAVPAFTGIVYVEDGVFNENISGFTYNIIHLKGSRLNGNITSAASGVVNLTSTRGLTYTENIFFPFVNAYVGTVSTNGGQAKIEGLHGFQGNIDSCAQFFIRNINVLSESLGSSIVTGTAFATNIDAVIENIGTILLSGGNIIENNPFTGARTVRIENVNRIRKTSVDTTSGLIGNIDGDTTVILSKCPITGFGGDIISGVTTTGNPRVLIINSNAKSVNGSLVNVSGSANNLEVLVSNGSSVDVDSTEAINWATNPSNKVTLKAYPGSVSNKPWNTAGVIDLATSSDYSTVDGNLEFDFIV